MNDFESSKMSNDEATRVADGPKEHPEKKSDTRLTAATNAPDN